ncbi:hypothetical protein [Streptomyces sp. SMS_SU21]|uniref:hypothetical protein n=1 Tax=Streptomyces sp. SMS_SU21 TaxID=2069440 RepID=UPI0015E7EDB6|nr:hypothetical protein [Streptomyces sp. SMS_SU21]MCA2205310.1 hypothetical protein [Streptomyces sp. SMS_SU21]
MDELLAPYRRSEGRLQQQARFWHEATGDPQGDGVQYFVQSGAVSAWRWRRAGV